MSLILDEHRRYLADEPRLAAFDAAVRALVCAGDVVLDLASGTGILALMACRAGARRVYAVESGSVIGLAREIAAANRFDDRIVFVQELSTRADLPEPVDAIVTDQIGRFGFDAGLTEYLPDARRRFLKPGGRTLPASVDLWIAAVEHAEQWGRADFWRRHPAGFSVEPARETAMNTGYPVRLDTSHLLSATTSVGSLPLGDEDAAVLEASRSLVILRNGCIHGLGGGFDAALAPGVRLSNLPGDPHRIGRRNVFFPFEHPVEVRAGDRVDLRLKIRPFEMIVTWSGEVRDDAGTLKGAFRGSTFRGMLLPPASLHRTAPDSVPILTPAGEARRSVLALCDGGRTLGEIEAEVFRRHRRLFGSPGHAAAFVAEVLAHYAR
jgi:protein arginine N-methyltransferase 1